MKLALNKRHDEQNKREGSAIADGIDFNGNFLNSIGVFIVKKICLFAEGRREVICFSGDVSIKLKVKYLLLNQKGGGRKFVN